MIRPILPGACALILAVSGCARIPLLNRLLPPPYYRYIDHPEFSFDYPRKWRGPQKVPGGVEFREPETQMRFSVAYFKPGDPEYRAPSELRRSMSEWGSVEDAHRVFELSVSSRPAVQVHFTTYEYDPEYLLGARVTVFLTQFIMVPDPKGVFLIRCRAPRDRFWKKGFQRPVSRLLGSLIMASHEVTAE